MEYYSLKNLLNIEINHKTAPIEVREKFFLDKISLEFFKNILNQDAYLKEIVKGVFILSTCNRTSLFFDLNLKENIQEFNFYNLLFDFDIVDINDILNKLNLSYIKDYLVVRKGLEAVENLIRIAFGLESQVFGETDIIKQIKQYYYYSKENNLLSPFLEILINKVLNYSKVFDVEVRSKFNYLKSSFANFIFSFIKKTANKKQLNLLFIGLGNVNKQILKLLIKDNSFLSKINEIFVVSNYYYTFKQKLSVSLNFNFFEKDKLKLVFDKIKDKLDFIIVNSKNFFLSYDYLRDISKNVTIFDLGLPRSVDPYISHFSNFELIDLDKFKKNNFYDVFDNLDVLNQIIESFIRSKIKEFYEYIVSRTLDRRLLNFYQEMYNIKEELLKEDIVKDHRNDYVLGKYIKKTIYRVSRIHKDFLGLNSNTGILRRQVILGSRGSKLALIQTQKVLNLLKNFFPDFEFFVKIIKTSGDKKIYTNNSFVKEIEEALVKEEIDIAVNSLKDMPYFINVNTNIAAVLNREEANDVLISKDNKSFWELPSGSVIGTSSLRRKEQLKLLRNDLIFKDITGNIDTRIKKLNELNELNEYYSIILAKAAIKRLNLEHLVSYEFNIQELVPAVGQGVIALQTRNNSYLNEILFKINNIKTFIEITIEREIMGLLKLGCRNPLGLYASIDKNSINIYYFFIINNNLFKGKKEFNLLSNKNFELILNIIKDKNYYFMYKKDFYEIINQLVNEFIKSTLVFI